MGESPSSFEPQEEERYGKARQEVSWKRRKRSTAIGLYDARTAFELRQGDRAAKFDESVDVALKLGVDPRHADQQVRGTVVLPHGTGRTVRVAVFAKGEKAKEAEAAGAEIVGAEDLAEKVEAGEIDFDVVVATPDMMGLVGRLGRILGPRGLMPNPKAGTVTMDVGEAVRQIKAGKVEFRVNKEAGIHVAIGKVSFDVDQLHRELQGADGRRCQGQAQRRQGAVL